MAWSGDRIPVGTRFSAPVHTGLGTQTASYTMGIGSSLGVKRPGRGVEHPPHLSPRLKKEENYTSIPPMGFRRLLEAELYFFFIWRNSRSGPGPPHSRGLQITHDTPQSVGLLWTSDQLVAETST